MGTTIWRAMSFAPTGPSRLRPYYTTPRQVFSMHCGSEQFHQQIEKSFATSPPVLSGLLYL